MLVWHVWVFGGAEDLPLRLCRVELAISDSTGIEAPPRMEPPCWGCDRQGGSDGSYVFHGDDDE